MFKILKQNNFTPANYFNLCIKNAILSFYTNFSSPAKNFLLKLDVYYKVVNDNSKIIEELTNFFK